MYRKNKEKKYTTDTQQATLAFISNKQSIIARSDSLQEHRPQTNACSVISFLDLSHPKRIPLYKHHCLPSPCIPLVFHEGSVAKVSLAMLCRLSLLPQSVSDPLPFLVRQLYTKCEFYKGNLLQVINQD